MQFITTLAAISDGVSVTKSPTIAEVQALISQHYEDRHFGHIGKKWIENPKSEGFSLIDKIYNVILRLEIEKDNIISYSNTLARERENVMIVSLFWR